ncbi:sulfatase-like hydrolase/transferase [uncultured Dokdonia sp.]|uniref:sulfatase-like hydrolase/transferase n=1 Tax=uncultured Dokdonia sp. TaxID=575653 RepID=UPI00262FA20B|nr:sulfatase-like hydrolase/transferase [uncultured Dokdonia sp.]
MKFYFLSCSLLLLLGCSSTDETSVTQSTNDNTENAPNILFIIADDLGKDAISGFTEGTIKPLTPHIDAIRNEGLSFSNFWSYPTCSPTRASILTGKYGYRTGVKWAGDDINLSERSLQQYITEESSNDYATAIIGKWHLSGNSSTFNPEVFGIDYYAGLLRGEPQSYYNWLLTEDGVSNIETAYATTKFTDLAINWVNAQDKPWFLWLAYNAPHTPYHVPPSDMHSQGNLLPFTDGMDETPYYMAAIEAMDFQIGQLLDSLSEEEKDNTVLIFIGDNGTPNEVAQNPYSFFTAKGSLNQGGINVPLFIAGKGVLRTGSDHNLITSTDIFTTIAQLAGVSSSSINDSKSFKPLLSQSATIRDYQYCEKDDGVNNLWTISNGDYKLFQTIDGDAQLYDLTSDPYEQENLLNGTLTTTQNAIKTALETELNGIRN